jgi:hypothetical protein
MEQGQVISPSARMGGDLDRLLAPAILAGMVAVSLAGLAGMITSWIAGSGFFTPVYGITSSISPATVVRSVHQAQIGNAFYVARDPLVAGGAVALTVGGTLAMLFLPLGRRLSPRWSIAVPAGIGYALLVMCVLTLIGLPTATRLAAASRPMTDLSSVVGWAVLLVEYGVYGAALGTWVVLRPGDLRHRLPGRKGGAAAS